MDKGHVPRKSRVFSGVRAAARGGRARAGTPTLPGCDSATLEPSARPAPRARTPGVAAPVRPRSPPLSPGRPRSTPRAKCNTYLHITARAHVTSKEIIILQQVTTYSQSSTELVRNILANINCAYHSYNTGLSEPAISYAACLKV